jgi:3-isopropylmalate/(R)-2-methylmalate dehydratase small subunit
MKATRTVTGTAAPLDRSDVDTDQIIPSDWLKQVSRTGFEKGLFSEWRDDRGFVLNDERYAGATILVAGTNFGTGSSREHAVWAIQQYGFEAVISPRFADIFRNNCTKNGLVPAQIQADAAAALMAAVQADPGLDVTVDVERLLVEAPAIGFEAAFSLEASTQQRFLEGLDDIGITLRHTEAIDDYEQRRLPWLPAAG